MNIKTFLTYNTSFMEYKQMSSLVSASHSKNHHNTSHFIALYCQQDISNSNACENIRNHRYEILLLQLYIYFHYLNNEHKVENCTLFDWSNLHTGYHWTSNKSWQPLWVGHTQKFSDTTSEQDIQHKLGKLTYIMSSALQFNRYWRRISN